MRSGRGRIAPTMQLLPFRADTKQHGEAQGWWAEPEVLTVLTNLALLKMSRVDAGAPFSRSHNQGQLYQWGSKKRTRGGVEERSRR